MIHRDSVELYLIVGTKEENLHTSQQQQQQQITALENTCQIKTELRLPRVRFKRGGEN